MDTSFMICNLKKVDILTSVASAVLPLRARVALYGLLSGPDLAGTCNTREIRHLSLGLT